MTHDRLLSVEHVDERNGLAWIGYEELPGCDRGLLFGRWIKRRPALGGLRGHIVGPSGEPAGRVRGVWGHSARRDANVFFGKAINPGGEPIALFGGTYGDGQAHGRWLSLHPRELGHVQIVYNDGGSFRRVATDARLRYAGDGHNHWHVRDMMTYHLWGSRGTLRDKKIGFCFFDTDPYQLSKTQHSKNDADVVFIRADTVGVMLTDLAGADPVRADRPASTHP